MNRKFFDIVIIVGILVALVTGSIREYKIANLQKHILEIKSNQIVILKIQEEIIYDIIELKQKSYQNRIAQSI